MITEALAGSAVIGAIGAAVIARGPAYRDLADRLSKVEARQDSLELALHQERRDHAATWDRLRSAWRYIREVLAWRDGPRVTDMPAPPADVARDVA